MHFRDRVEAGQLLARELSWLRDEKSVIVLGVPRGGVVVANEVAKALHAPLDVYITRKLGAPHNPELAIGALASDGSAFLDPDAMRSPGVTDEYVQSEIARQRKEIARRMTSYRGARPAPDLHDKTVVLVDDGVATGATVLASLRAIRQHRPKQLILAVPVGAADSIASLQKEADRVICLYSPEVFWAVGSFYSDFHQTLDEEVIQMLAQRP
jgi:putative phosphoribosyl transferase